MADRPELSPMDLEGQVATELPAREAMTLIDTSSGLLPMDAYAADTADPTGEFGSATPDSEYTAGATDTASGVADTAADASGSESGTADTTSADRSDTIMQSDSAYVGPS